MSGPVPSPPMHGNTGRSGTSRLPSARVRIGSPPRGTTAFALAMGQCVPEGGALLKRNVQESVAKRARRLPSSRRREVEDRPGDGLMLAMPPLPIVSAADCVKALARLGYRIARQKGSHVRLV